MDTLHMYFTYECIFLYLVYTDCLSVWYCWVLCHYGKHTAGIYKFQGIKIRRKEQNWEINPVPKPDIT
jgi:hypothetical protein